MTEARKDLLNVVKREEADLGRSEFPDIGGIQAGTG